MIFKTRHGDKERNGISVSSLAFAQAHFCVHTHTEVEVQDNNSERESS